MLVGFAHATRGGALPVLWPPDMLGAAGPGSTLNLTDVRLVTDAHDTFRGWLSTFAVGPGNGAGLHNVFWTVRAHARPTQAHSTHICTPRPHPASLFSGALPVSLRTCVHASVRPSVRPCTRITHTALVVPQLSTLRRIMPRSSTSMPGVMAARRSAALDSSCRTEAPGLLQPRAAQARRCICHA